MNLQPNEIACDPEKLRQIVHSSLDDIDTDQIEVHLASCQRCQNQLEQIAGDDQFWNKATTALMDSKDLETDASCDGGSHVFVKIDPLMEVDELAIVHQHDAGSLLDPHVHPEMLGRVDGFSVEQMIGRGGMGVVYKGFDAELNRPVAIKFLAPHLAANGIARQRFAREARAAAAVVHPNVVPIYSVNSSPVRPYLVMGLVSGRSLRKHVADHGPLPIKDVVRIAQQIAAGLSAAHEQGLVHRDIKPANILLEKDVSRVMITDFGLARAADEASLTQSGWLAGTPHYMSPEQAAGDYVDHRSDLFSLGSVIYFMATGREPFHAEKSIAVLQKIATSKPQSPRAINNEVPAVLEDLIDRLHAKQPAKRFESAQQVQELLTRYLAWLQNPTTRRPPKLGLRGSVLRRSPRRSVILWAWAMLLPISMCVGYFCFVWLNHPSTPKSNLKSNAMASRVNNVSPAIPAYASPPAWVVNDPSNDEWLRELQQLDSQMSLLEQPVKRTNPEADFFETETSKLREQIEAMERWLGTNR